MAHGVHLAAQHRIDSRARKCQAERGRPIGPPEKKKGASHCSLKKKVFREERVCGWVVGGPALAAEN